MPRKKQIPSDARATTAIIPVFLKKLVDHEVTEVGGGFGLAMAINEGLVLWLASRKGENAVKNQLEFTLSEWKIKLAEQEKAEAHEKATQQIQSALHGRGVSTRSRHPKAATGTK